MKKEPFGKTGLLVAPLGIGCTDSREVMTHLLDAGANLVDTAQCYGEHEVFLGDSIAHRREEFILQTKCGHHDVLPDGTMRSRAISMADIDRALVRLRTDHLDVMLLHSYDRDLLEQGEAVAVLSAAKKAGKIRLAGYSGDNESASVAAAMEDLDVIETSISIADQHNIGTLLPVTVSLGKGVVAKRPVANAAWRFLGAHSEQPANSGTATYVARLKAMRLDLPALGFPETPAGWSELAFRFNLGIPGLDVSIISTKSVAHAQANVEAVARGPLDPGVFTAIRDAFLTAGQAEPAAWRGEN